MTGDRDKFKSLVIKDGAKVSFGGNQRGKITGVGEVGPVKDVDRKSTRLNSSHSGESRMPSSA